MLTIGVDAHKHLLVAVAVNPAGRELASCDYPNTPQSWTALLDWALELGPDREWGVEGSGGLGRGCAQQLVAAGERVYEVNSRLTAPMRKRGRRLDKNDHRDALAIARIVLREDQRLPQVYPDANNSVVALLTADRATIQADMVRTRNQLHQTLHQLDPVYQRRWSKLTDRTVLEALQTAPPVATTQREQALVDVLLRYVARLLLLDTQRTAVTQELELHGRLYYQDLTEVRGVSALTAAMLAGLLGTPGRFETDAQMASYAGVAPLEVSSSGHERHRLNRTGNRQFNAVLHRIALTQWRYEGEGRDYLLRKQAEGKSLREAMRALKRFIARRIYQIWKRMHAPHSLPTPQLLT